MKVYWHLFLKYRTIVSPRDEESRTIKKKARAATGIRSAREKTVFEAPRQISGKSVNHDSRTRKLNSPHGCYVCKAEYTRLHHFYDSMCPECADFNYKKRFQTAPLDGQVALITGSRLKIGYQAALMILRAGASVIATTRFPVDSAGRYSREADYEDWKDHQIRGITRFSAASRYCGWCGACVRSIF